MQAVHLFSWMLIFCVAAAHASYYTVNSTLYQVEEIVYSTTNSIDQVVSTVNNSIGFPVGGIPAVLAACQAAGTPEGCKEVIAAAAGPYGLIYFARYNFTGAIALMQPPGTPLLQTIRYLIGNPETLFYIWQKIPDAAYYVPRSILIDQHADGKTHLTYNTAESYLRATSTDREGLELARQLDENIIHNILEKASL